MPVSFSADEIYEMAEQIERNGAGFYRKASESMTDPKMKDLLKDLITMEIQHEQTFAALRTELTADDQTPCVFDPDGEGALYLRALADGHVFDIDADPSDMLSGSETAADVLDMAISLEKDSIVFYVGMEGLMPAKANKGRIKAIIDQEIAHIALLSDKLTELG